MSDILCLDTEPETIAALREVGHNVVSVPFGYRDGLRSLHVPPQDFDLILSDLKQPACFDSLAWMHRNDNYKCEIVPPDELTWEPRYISNGPGQAPKKDCRYRMIQESQIVHMNAPSPFGPNDIRKAIALGSVPALIFINPEWGLRAAGHGFPLFVGVQWEIAETNVTKFAISEPLEGLTKKWDPALRITTPIRCQLTSQGHVLGSSIGIKTTPTIIDRIGGVLGQFVMCGEGAIWLLPKTESNPEVARAFAAGI